MGEFNSHYHCIYFYRQEYFRRNGVALIVNKRIQNAVTWVQSQIWLNDLDSFPRQTIQHNSNPSLCPNHRCWRSWIWIVLWRSTRPSITNAKKKMSFFIIRDWNAKVRSQEILKSNRLSFALEYKMKQGKANRVLSREHTGHKQQPFPTAQEMTVHVDITKWSVPKSDWLYCSQRWRSCIYMYLSVKLYISVKLSF